MDQNQKLLDAIESVPSRKRDSFIYKIKNTLARDLACRLPYGHTKLRIFDKEKNAWTDQILTPVIWERIKSSDIGLMHVKVYLRPVNSLTQAECDIIFNEVLGSEGEATKHGDWIKFRCDGGIEFIFNRRPYRDVQKLYDWMYEHDIDINNLEEYNMTMSYPPLLK
jgi:hypothetical protein